MVYIRMSIKKTGHGNGFNLKKKQNSQKLLKENVLDTGLCTGCGACVSLCPYQVTYHDRTVQLHTCDLTDGKCRAFCPRTEVNLAHLRSCLFAAADMTPEIGSVKGYYFSRAGISNYVKYPSMAVQ